ncbi:glycosyltransferase family 39 protein [Catenuloplanes indicus]|uniref:Glycosyltransferase RgtA/B/C/D-like domain-containing protein n=1 Tax=Catenuloplanes indicus TaxID=137267 RepID=A0AAE3VX15_9ACTN|nr:glycosyltransferase family 39 protein [Catenuloplanes indicus]MDQ0365391.1 hypothetical protein [Catenuloplanes indicus]
MRILALLVVVLGSAARIVRWLADQPLWLDEQMIAINIRDRGFAGLATDLAHDQSAPIGWLWLQRVVYLALGDGGLALRLVPLLFGVGTLVLAYWAGRRLLGPAGTLALVTLLAVNGSLIRYATELKQYSADAFTVLSLLVLAVAAVRRPASARRAWLFWGTAAVTGLFSTAAIMATPGIALVVLVVAVRGTGWLATARRHAVGVVLWTVSLGAHYLLALRYALGDDTLAALNARLGFPPDGLVPTARWLLARPLTLAGDPIGVPWWLGVAFWLLALAGAIAAALPPRGTTPAPGPTATGTPGSPPDAPAASGSGSAGSAGSAGFAGWRRGERWVLGLLLAAPVVTAFGAAAVHAVPLYGRFAVQLLPPLFLAVAIATDVIASVLTAAVRSRAGLRRSAVRPSAPRPPGPRPAAPRRFADAVRALLAAAGAVVLAALAVFAVAPAAVAAARPAPLTNGVDDRAAIAALTAAYRPGDLVVVTPSSWPAVEWYAGATTFGRVLLLHTTCMRSGPVLEQVAPDYARVLVYLGMQAGGTPGEAKVATMLARHGTVTGPERFGAGALYTLTPGPAAPGPVAAVPLTKDDCLKVIAVNG